jgi:uncharacterized protein YegL
MSGQINSTTSESKLSLANAALKTLFGKLTKDDSFSLVTFNSTAHVVIPLTSVSLLNIENISALVDNMCAGLNAAYGAFPSEAF